MDIEFVRLACMNLPAVTEDVKWDNDLVFSIGGKMFCVVWLEPPFTCSFKVRDEDYEDISNQEGFIPAPYMARAKWVQVVKPDQLTKKEWEDSITLSYELVKAKLTKKQRSELGI